MAPWRYDPYLWVHLAGLATVPLWINLCLMGLAVGNPTLPGLELGAIVGLGVVPVLVMQLRRPFYIYSLPGIALRPAVLNTDQRRMLSQFRRWRVRLGALLVPVPLVWVLVKLYPLAFLARDITPFGDWGRIGGIAIAVVSFFLANLFSQVPAAVLQVLVTPDRHMTAVLPYPTETIAADFSWLGLPVSKLLPSLVPQNLPPQAEPDAKADNEGLRPKLLDLEHQALKTSAPLGLDVPTGEQAVKDAHHLAIAPGPLAGASDPKLTAEPSEGLISEQNHLPDAHPFYELPEASHQIKAAVAESSETDDGEGLDDAEADQITAGHMEIDDLGRNGSAPIPSEDDALEDASSSPNLMSHSEPWPIAADATPQFSQGTSRHL